MRRHPSDDELLRSYLRGELPEPEADVLERRLLVEDELFDLLEALEAELLAAAGRGELPPAERGWVLRRLASSPRGRERLALARSLNTLADGLPEARPAMAPVVSMPYRFSRPKLVWSRLAVAAVLLLAVGLWQQPHPHLAMIDPLPLPEPHPRDIDGPTGDKSLIATDRKGDDHGPRQRPLVKAVFTLALATLRGAEEIEAFRVPPGTDVIEIQLDIEGWEGFKSFHAAVQSPGKEPIWEKAGLRPRRLKWATALVLDIPVDRLPENRYQAVVKPDGETEEVTKDFEIVQETR